MREHNEALRNKRIQCARNLIAGVEVSPSLRRKYKGKGVDFCTRREWDFNVAIFVDYGDFVKRVEIEAASYNRQEAIKASYVGNESCLSLNTDDIIVVIEKNTYVLDRKFDIWTIFGLFLVRISD